MNNRFQKFIASFAISGLVLYWASPAMAATNYDPNDRYFDPSGTYVPSVSTVISDSNAVTGPTTMSDSLDVSAPDSAIEARSDLEKVENAGTALTDQSNDQQSLAILEVDKDSSDLDQNQVSMNAETGSDSTNISATSAKSNTETVVENKADLSNQVTAKSTTGEDIADKNTGEGSIKTGDSDVVVNIINMANSIVDSANSLALPIINYFGDLIGNLSFLGDQNNNAKIADNSSLTQIASNTQTGAESNNESQISNDSNNKTLLQNAGSILNKFLFGANTGNNSASDNIGNGSIQTGDANVASNVVNFLNNTIMASNLWMGMVNIFGNWAGDLLLPSFAGTNSSVNSADMSATNSKTGADSENTALNNLSGSSDTTITNGTNIIDEINIEANTGQNESTKNTLNGNIQSGNINVKNNMLSVANNTITGDNWWMMIINSLNGWQGAIVGAPDGSQTFVPFMFGSSATNETTGADSINDAIISSDQSQTTEINNNGQIDNTITLSANTGKNIASKNTGSGDIKTGDANVMSNLVNFVNNTFNVKNWMFGIVNVFGTWKGSAKFGDGKEGSTLSSGDTSLSASNNQTGAESDNKADIDSSNSTKMTINNDLKFDSTQTIKANTGKNTTDKNTGDGNIQSGDIAIDSSLTLYGNITQLADNSDGLADLNADASNSQTGPDSDNTAIIKFIGKVKIVINNIADVCKKVTMDLNTGKNSADKNTGDKDISTGNVDAKFKDAEVINSVTVVKPVPKMDDDNITDDDNIILSDTDEGGIGGIGEFQEKVTLAIASLPMAGAESVIPVVLLATLFSLIFWRRKIFKSLITREVKQKSE